MESTKRFQTIGGMGPHASQLVEILKDGKPGDVLTDEELTNRIGRDTRPKGNGYGNLTTAIRHVCANYQVNWHRVRGADAIKCLTSKETAESSLCDLAHVRRHTRRSLQRMATVKQDELPEEQRATFNVLTAQMGTLAAFAKTSTTKKLESRSVQSVPDIGRLLEVWK